MFVSLDLFPSELLVFLTFNRNESVETKCVDGTMHVVQVTSVRFQLSGVKSHVTTANVQEKHDKWSLKCA